MAKEIGLKIKISSQGGEKVISNINDLETELQNLQTTLKTLDFGSDAYKEATKNIGVLKSALRDIDKEIEGVDREQAFQAFSLAINGVTGAFLIASSAARTFGAEQQTIEEVAKAEQAALEAVNIALGVQAVAETIANAGKIKSTALRIKDTIATNAATAAQTAYNVVVGTSTGLLKAFRIALAATGIGLFVLGLTELISYLNDYIEEQQQATKVSEEFAETSKKVAQDIGDEIAEVEILTDTIKDETLSEKQRQKALDDLQKKYPNYFKNLKKDIDDTKTLEQQKQKLIQTLILEAQNRAATNKITEATTEALNKKLDEENKLKKRLSETDAETLKIQEKISRIRAGTFTPLGFEGREQEAINLLKKDEATFQEIALKAKQKYEREAKRIDRELETTIKSYTKAIKVNTEQIEENGGATELNTDKKEENKKKTEEQIKAEKDYQDALRASVDAFKDINFEGTTNVKILEEANKVIEKQTDLLNKRKETLKTQSQLTKDFNNELNELVGGVLIPDEKFSVFNDNYLNFLNNVFAQIKVYRVEDAKEQQKIFKETLKLVGVEKLRKEIGDESLETLFNYFQTSVDIQDSIEKYNNTLSETDKKNKSIKTENLSIKQIIFDINKINENRLENLQSQKEANTEIKELVSQRLFNTKDINSLSEEQKQILDSITKTLTDQAKLFDGIYDVNKELNELTGKIGKNITEQQKKLEDTTGLENFIKNNVDKIDEIQTFFNNLKAENSNLTEEQIENIQKLIDGIKIDKKRTELIENIQDIASVVLEVFSELSGRLSSIFDRNNQILFEQLAQAEEQTLALVGDATEREREEQLKLQKEYAKKRFDLEKKARIQELQFTLANSIASGAQAVIQALGLAAPPPIPQLYAAAIAGLTGVEILSIKDQIGTAKASTFVGRRGGLIQGATHEGGGVPALLEGGEFVMSRPAVDRFGDIVGQMNQSVGGRGLQIDDSRIVQAISSQNTTKTPIKTYVVYQDIKDTDKLNNRIQKLSRL